MYIGSAAVAAPLLERGAELRALEDALAAARVGVGGVTLVEGQAGTGKSRLLDEASTLAASAGMDVLRATGDEHERDFPFGVCLQLFEERLWRATDPERAELLSGAAGRAGRLFDAETVPGGHDDVLRLAHGLFWVAHNLAERSPLALIVDDLHCADVPSLRFLLYLANRIGNLNVAVVCAARNDLGARAATPLAALAALPLARVLQLAPLSQEGVATLVLGRLPDASQSFCEACSEATHGNPFFVEELLRTLAADEIPATDAGAAAVLELVPEAVSRSILLRLSLQPPEGAALARAVAVLGEAALADAAALARVDPDDAHGIADALAAAGVLAEGDVLAYPHPIIRAAVYEDMPRAERGRMELHGAEILLAAGAPVERASSHLLAAPPSRQPWVIDPLRLAAARALARGAPDSAVRYLRRALDEPPPPAVRAEVLVELGNAEAAAGELKAPERLATALELLDDPLARARVQLIRGRSLSAQGRFTESASAFADGALDARGLDIDLVVKLEAGYLGVARFKAEFSAAASARIEQLARQPSDEDVPGERAVLADVALGVALSGAPAAAVLPLADRAWADGALLDEQGLEAHSIYVLAGAFQSADQLERDLEVLDEALRRSRRQGSIMAVATASYCRSIPLYYLARIPEAVADAELAVRAERDGWDTFLPSARAYLALSLLERDDLEGAERALELGEPERWRQTLPYAPYLDARARLLLARRQPTESLEVALELGRLLEETYGRTGRGYLQWRVTAALAAGAAGDHELATRLCAEELELARAGDRPREIGAALRAQAVLEPGEPRIELLKEAVETLERSESTLELLRALVDYGAALRRAGRRREAREPLRRALDVASTRGASALAERARQELLASGARPRRTALGGVEALTPSELRVARLAADGLLNREIAESLFVSRKTVDYHLHHVYQKLDVTRAGLAGALAAKD